MGDEHRTTCWMTELIRGSDADKASLRSQVLVALRSCGGNITSAAVLLDVHTATLARYVNRLGLGGAVERLRSTPAAKRAQSARLSRAGRLGGRPRKPG